MVSESPLLQSFRISRVYDNLNTVALFQNQPPLPPGTRSKSPSVVEPTKQVVIRQYAYQVRKNRRQR